MKTPVHSLPGLVLAGALLLGLAVLSANAQSYSIIHSFGTLSDLTGFHPVAPLIQGPDGTLYGTTSQGEYSLGLGGAVFKIQPDGSGFTVLKHFTNYAEARGPQGGLVLSATTLYGTTESNGGTVFKLNTDGVVTVAWEKAAEGWVLERTNRLPSVAVPWPPAPGPYGSNSTDFFVTTDAPVGRTFFRLHKP